MRPSVPNRRSGKSTLYLAGYTVLDMHRLSLRAAILSLLLLLTAFTVPLIAPLRASSAHLPAALAVVLVGAGLAVLVLSTGDRTGAGAPGSEPESPQSG